MYNALPNIFLLTRRQILPITQLIREILSCNKCVRKHDVLHFLPVTNMSDGTAIRQMMKRLGAASVVFGTVDIIRGSNPKWMNGWIGRQ